MIERPSILWLTALLCGAAACGDADIDVQIFLPQELGLTTLPAASQERLRVLASIPGVLEPSPMRVDLGKDQASGSFTLADTNVTQAELKIEVFSGLSESSSEVLLARSLTLLSIERGKRNQAKVERLTSEGEAIFDLNRNGVSNLADLIAGIDPAPGETPVDISPQAVSFTSGVEVGGFTRSFFVVENSSGETIDLSLDVRLAPGVSMVPLSLLFDNGGASASTRISTSLGPRSEEVFALTFAPANPLFLVGSVAIGSRSQRSGVEHNRLMRILGNPEGAVPQAPPDYSIPLPAAGTPIGGYRGVVTGYPVDSLFSRAPTITTVAEVDAGGIGAIDIDAAYIVAVLPRHRFALTLDGLLQDVDVHLFELDPTNSFAPVGVVPLQSSVHAGLSAEAVEFDNTGNKTSTVLLMIAFDGVVVDQSPAGQDLATALQHEPPRGIRGTTQTALFSVPEFLPPCPLNDAGVADPGCVGPITSVTPCPAFYGHALACGDALGSTQVTLRGRNFKGGLAVRVGSSPAVCTPVTLVAAAGGLAGYEQVTCLAPPAVGDSTVQPNVTVVLTNPDGQAATLAEGFTYLPPAPVVFSVAPRSGPLSGGTPLSIQGSGFFAGESGLPEVRIGAQIATAVALISPVQLTATLPSCAACSAGQLVDVRVINPDLQEGSLFSGFEYKLPEGPAPGVLVVSPAQGHRNGGTVVTVNGTGFVDGAIMRIGGATASGVVVVNGSAITGTSPPGSPGPSVVEVVNPDGQTGRLAAGFIYEVPQPVVSAILPALGPQVGGTTVFITGRDFQQGAQVFFAGVLAASININSSSSITCVSPPGLGGTNATLQVTNLDGRSHSLPAAFRYNPPSGPPPSIALIDPSQGSTAGGATLTITGQGFVVGSTVFFGQSSATSVARLSDSSLTAIAPPHTQGVVGIRVRNPDGQSAELPGSFAFINPAPQPTGVLPPQGPVSGGTVVQIYGSGFVNGASVLFGGSPAINVAVLASTAIRCTAPAHAAAVVAVTVNNPDGQGTTVATAFSYVEPVQPAPQVSFLQPAAGSAAGGTRVEVHGSNFDPATTQVSFDDAPAYISMSESSASLLVVAAPPGTPNTTVTTRVQNEDGQTDFAVYRYTAEPPPFLVTSMVPNSGEAYEATPVFIVGQAFASAAGAAGISVEVRVGSWRMPASSVVLLSDQLLSATLPPYTGTESELSLVADILVSKNDGAVQSATLVQAYTFDDVSECVPTDLFACGASTCLSGQCSTEGQEACVCSGPQCTCVALCGPGSDTGSCGCGGTCAGGTCTNVNNFCSQEEICDGLVCVEPCAGVCTGAEQCILDPQPRCLDLGSCDNNGLRTYPEHCDGADLGGVRCFDLGFDGGALSCASDCRFDTSGCTLAGTQCDGTVLDPGEACDGGAFAAGGTCATFGFAGGVLQCTAACQVDFSACTTAPFTSPPGCGNRRRDALAASGFRRESCDGSDLGGINSCQDAHGALGAGKPLCTNDCQVDLSTCAVNPCGDGRLNELHRGGEEFYREECDGVVFAEHASCGTFASPSGVLACDASCRINTSGCTAPPVTCGNKTQDSGESDIDCGGPCGPCADGRLCLQAAECHSGVCVERCIAPTCADGVRNGDEGAVDCGGPCPTRCPAASPCAVDEDCDPLNAPLCINALCTTVGCSGVGGCPFNTTCDVGTGQCQPPLAPAVGCMPGQFVCLADMTCLDGKFRCDAMVHCGDGADEIGCVGTCNGTLDFVCGNTFDCVSSAVTCNGTADCPGALDEAGFCGCPAGSFLCADQIQCLPGADVCDGGLNNCVDGSDELASVCTGLGCGGANDFVCADQQECVPKGLICNGTNNCGDGSDEAGLLCCPPWLFDCGNGVCLPATEICNGVANQCGAGIDEDATCPANCPGDFLCTDRSRCLTNVALCDGAIDCTDGSDEDSGFCGVGHCSDGLLNVDESNIDCGGADCIGC